MSGRGRPCLGLLADAYPVTPVLIQDAKLNRAATRDKLHKRRENRCGSLSPVPPRHTQASHQPVYQAPLPPETRLVGTTTPGDLVGMTVPFGSMVSDLLGRCQHYHWHYGGRSGHLRRT